MDQFYLDNAALYQTLVKAVRPPPALKAGDTVAETTSPDMVVGARIRPLLDEDIAAGFPCAVFPRSSQIGMVDIHDLYNHPRGRPILKVSHAYQLALRAILTAETLVLQVSGRQRLRLPNNHRGDLQQPCRQPDSPRMERRHRDSLRLWTDRIRQDLHSQLPRATRCRDLDRWKS